MTKLNIPMVILMVGFSLLGTSAGSKRLVDTDTIPTYVDTIRLKAIIDSKINQVVNRKVVELDLIKQEMLDSATENLSHAKKIKHWLRYRDLDKRPNGHVYEWRWWYWITKEKGVKDTVWDKMEVQRIN
jgi:hypothetical protein